MLVTFAGIVFFTSAFIFKVPKDVTVNGVDVGGKSFSDAALCVRKKIEDDISETPLKIVGEREYLFTCPEIGFKDDLKTLLKKVKRGGSYEAKVSYYLKDISGITARICADEEVCASEPYYIFNTVGEPFTYVEGACGRRANRLKLIADIEDSLASGFKEVHISFTKTQPFKSLESVKYDTRLLSSFTTYFDGGNADRAHNISLAAASVNGVILERGDSFSFNETVGARTAARGYKTAKIISGGEFVDGVGGGVCQVSTTLFNAAILSGCKICESHPHSLTVGYVAPSCDAMVSGDYYDLKFENITGSRLFIRARTGESSVTFEIYGRGDGAEYSYSSKTVRIISPPVETVKSAEEVRQGKAGAVSEGYLTVKRGGFVTTKFIRRDKYASLSSRVYEGESAEEKEENDEAKIS